MKQNEIYYPLIDWVRFFSAFYVMVDHFSYNNARVGGVYDYWINVYNGWFDYSPVAKFASMGSVGVDFFFIISGLVISHSVHKGLFKFALNRFLRIFPTLWVFATIALVCTYFATDIDGLFALFLWFKSIVLFPFGPWLDGVYWTLIIELFFYFLIFLSWYFYLEKGQIYLMYFLTLLSFTSMLLAFIADFYNFEMLKAFLFSYKAKPLMISTGQAFALGMALQYIKRDGFKLNYIVVVVASSIATFLWIYLRSMESPDLVPYVLTLTVIVFAVFYIGLFVKFNHRKSFLSISKLAGKATYPIYLFHNIAGSLFLLYLVQLGLNIWLALLVAMFFVIFFCCIYAHYLESKIVGLCKDFILQKTANFNKQANV